MGRTVLRVASLVALAIWTTAPLATAQVTARAQAKSNAPSNEWMAWKLGREYGFASAWTLMKRSAQMEKSLAFARTAAKALGIAEPPAPGDKYMENVVAMAKEIGAKHGEPVRNHFLVGVRMTDAWFGAAIGADVTTQLKDLGSFLAKSGIPQTVWSTQMTAIKAKASEPDLKKLADSIDAHLRR
jgi:hypothetical protein